MKIAIFGYGNLGRGAEVAAKAATDMSLVGIFTRRQPLSLVSPYGTPIYEAEKIKGLEGSIDILLLCTGSTGDWPVLTPRLARSFHVVDSFDTHQSIQSHIQTVDTAARSTGHAALITGGWDPGLFSLMRLYANAVLPECQTATLWGPCISQGHSEAIRRLPGVKDALAYTLPQKLGDADALGSPARCLHQRRCFVVPRPNADLSAISSSIISMPHFFAEYPTEVIFVTSRELDQMRGSLSHRGTVIAKGATGQNPPRSHCEKPELYLDSNPDFAGSVLVCLARCLGRMVKEGKTGAFTVFDIPPSFLLPNACDSRSIPPKIHSTPHFH